MLLYVYPVPFITLWLTKRKGCRHTYVRSQLQRNLWFCFSRCDTTVCCRSLAVGLLDEMSDLGAPPDSVTFASAMLACERAKQWQQVLRIMDQVREHHILAP